MENKNISYIKTTSTEFFPYELKPNDNLNNLLEYITVFFSLEMLDQNIVKSSILYENKEIKDLSSIKLTNNTIKNVTINLKVLLLERWRILKRRDIFNTYKNLNKNINIISLEEVEMLELPLQGGMANVSLCEYKQKKCILKKYHNIEHLKYLIEEINFYAVYHHSNFPEFYGIVIENQNMYKNIGILIEYIEGKDLLQYITSNKGNLSDKEKFDILNQVIKIISFLHGLNLIHRDLKPNNFLIHRSLNHNDFVFKVYAIDFGSFKNVNSDLTNTSVVGSDLFIAPEYTNNNIMGLFTDIWSLGCLIYYVLNENLLFNKPLQIYEYLDKNILPAELKTEYEQIIIKKCLDKDCYNRPTITYIENLTNYYSFKRFELEEEKVTIMTNYK